MELDREILAFCAHIEALLGANKTYAQLWKAPSQLLLHLRDGILLGDLIQSIRPSAIDVRKLKRDVDVSRINKSKSGDVHEIYNNLNVCLAAVQSMGIKLVNAGPEDFIDMNLHIVLGVVWQLVRISLMTKVNLEDNPELVRLLNKGEKLRQLFDLSGEKLLLRWVNYHLRKEDSQAKLVTTFKNIAVDQLMTLMQQVVPRKMETTMKARIRAARRLSVTSKAQFAVDCAELLGCRKFIGVATLVNGDPRLMHAFVATLFNQHIGIYLPSEEETKDMVYRIGVLTDEVQRLKKRLETAEANNDLVVHIQKEVGNMREEVRLADEEAEAQEREIDGLRKVVEEKETEIARLKEKLLAADAELEETSSDVKDFRDTVASLENQLRQVTEKNKDMQTTIKRLEDDKTKLQRTHRETRSQGITSKNRVAAMEETINRVSNMMAGHLKIAANQQDDDTLEDSLAYLASQMIAYSSKTCLELDGANARNESLRMRQEVLLDKTAAIAEAQLNDQKNFSGGGLTPRKMFQKWGNSVGKAAKVAGGSLRRPKREIKSVKNMNFEVPEPKVVADDSAVFLKKTPPPRPALSGARQMGARTTPGDGETNDDEMSTPKRVSFARTRSNSSPGRIASPGRIDFSQDVSTSKVASDIVNRAMLRAKATMLEAAPSKLAHDEHETKTSPTPSVRSMTGIPERNLVSGDGDENNPRVLNMRTTPTGEGTKFAYVEDDIVDHGQPAMEAMETPKRRRRRPLRTQQQGAN